jgi:spore maturation protein CgeB
MGYPIFGEEHARLFCSARINVNIHSPMEGFGINHRAFEIAGAGGFQLVDWRYGLDRYFKPDREIATFKTPAELREKVEYFLKHSEERAAIAQRGYEKARREFTLDKRFQELLAIVGAG